MSSFGNSYVKTITYVTAYSIYMYIYNTADIAGKQLRNNGVQGRDKTQTEDRHYRCRSNLSLVVAYIKK